MDRFMKTPSKPDNFFSIDPTGVHTRKAGEYLVGFARGYYGELGDLPQRMAVYMKKNNIAVFGPVYIIYLLDEICIHEASRYLAQACVAVSNNK